jgi:hypothetical protein
MKNYLCSAALVAGLALFAGAFAQVPVGSTGLCKDGSYSSAESKKGACAKHGGVKEWYATGATSEKAVAPATAEGTKSTAAAPTRPGTASQTTSPVAGGGPGQVWVNTRSKVYHCQGDKWYGKTMKGAYMTEEAAKAAGSHADHGKACT